MPGVRPRPCVVSERVANFVGDFPDTPPIGFDDHVGDLTVERVTNLHERLEHGAWIIVLQQRSIAAPRRPIQLLRH